MREIKYRAYIKKDYSKELVGKILEVSSIHLKTKKAIIGYSISKSNYGNKSFSFEDIELMQYTGLKDKNGNEIYEGDIIQDDFYERKAEVVFLEGAFWLDYKEDFEKYGTQHKRYQLIGNYSSEEVLEIIGNIHDNKDLLGEGE